MEYRNDRIREWFRISITCGRRYDEGTPVDERSTIDLQTAIRHMVASAGMSYAQVSRELNRNDRYLSIMLNDATTPRADLLARIAEVCGYSLQLVGHGETLEIKPGTGEGVSLEVLQIVDDAVMRLTGTTDVDEMLDVFFGPGDGSDSD